jgi:hypothetical protein
MAKRGRTATPIELIEEGQCIELEGQLIIRVSTKEKVIVQRYYGDAGDDITQGYMLGTYRDRIRVFFEDDALVDLVDESTLTHVGTD